MKDYVVYIPVVGYASVVVSGDSESEAIEKAFKELIAEPIHFESLTQPKAYDKITGEQGQTIAKLNVKEIEP
jgi:hypothetical protein